MLGLAGHALGEDGRMRHPPELVGVSGPRAAVKACIAAKVSS
jgi:hypothetical protein